MIAVGNQYLITSDTGSLAFYDKQGNVLPVTNGMPTTMSANTFFYGFLAETNADGSFNESNINHHLGFPKPCDSPEYPQTVTGKRFCIDSFYDTRVFFDATSKRFFVISNSRHPLWTAAKYKDDPKYGTCGVYQVSDDHNVGSDDYCDLTRRYVAFAVSKTEDPRDGFHQYILTENNNRDFPWMAVNGNAFIIANKGEESTVGPVATVFSVNAVKSGDQHPAYFRYYIQDLGGVGAAIPPTHYKNAAGLSFLLAGSGDRIDIFAFRQAADPWTGPALLKTSVTLDGEIDFYNAVYRSGKLYLVGSEYKEEVGAAKRYSVRLVRVPIEEPSASSIKASKSASKGFLDVDFGKHNQADPPGVRISYEEPALAVNKNGDMLFAYGRYPFSPADALNPEARYSYWYGNETKQRPSHLLQAGTVPNSTSIITAIHYMTAVVDPSNDLTFWMAVPYSAGGAYKTVIGKVTP